jgi:hypothetical protein
MKTRRDALKFFASSLAAIALGVALPNVPRKKPSKMLSSAFSWNNKELMKHYDRMLIRRYEPLPMNIHPLVEGEVPVSNVMKFRKVRDVYI